MKTGLQFRFYAIMIAMSLLIPLVGCSKAPATGTVSGKVMLGDDPLTLGKITFINQEKGAGGSTTLGEDGLYQISGSLPLGEYNVYFANAMKPGSLDPADVILSPVKQKYKAADSSGLTFEIKQGENVANFNLEK